MKLAIAITLSMLGACAAEVETTDEAAPLVCSAPQLDNGIEPLCARVTGFECSPESAAWACEFAQTEHIAGCEARSDHYLCCACEAAP